MERIEGLPSMATFIGQALHPTVRTCDTVGARLEQLRTQARPRLLPPLPPPTHPPHHTHMLVLTPSQYLGLSREVSNGLM